MEIKKKSSVAVKICGANGKWTGGDAGSLRCGQEEDCCGPAGEPKLQENKSVTLHPKQADLVNATK